MRLLDDLAGEAMPAGFAGLGEVPSAGLADAVAEDRRGRIRDPRRRRRRADLIGDHAQFVALACQAQHGPQEIRAVRGIHPGCAQDRVARATGADCRLPCKLAGAVHAERRGGIVFAIRARAAAVEHVIGRVVQQQRIHAGTRLRKRRRSFCIDPKRRLRLAFGAIHRGVGSRIDDHVRGGRAHKLGKRVRLVEICDSIRADAIACRHHQFAQRRQAAPQLAANLAIAAQQQQFHAISCGSRSAATSASNGAAASLGDSETSARGQSMASCGSSQRSELSLSRS